MLGKKHGKELSALHQLYSSKIDHLNNVLQDTESTVQMLSQANKSLKNVHSYELDCMKVEHREAMTALKQCHSAAIMKKNELLQQCNETIQGYEEMFT